MTVNIPEFIEIEDINIHRTMTFKFVRRIGNTSNFLYENIKTGCKQCFNVRDLVKLKKEEVIIC